MIQLPQWLVQSIIAALLGIIGLTVGRYGIPVDQSDSPKSQVIARMRASEQTETSIAVLATKMEAIKDSLGRIDVRLATIDTSLGGVQSRLTALETTATARP